MTYNFTRMLMTDVPT